MAAAPRTWGAEHEVLALWERAAALPPPDRDDALLAAEAGAALRSLGRRNAALLQLRARLLGNSLGLRCDCPRCAAAAEFEIDCGGLAQALLPAPGQPAAQWLEDEGWRVQFRVPDVDDLRAAAAGDAAAFGATLLRRCVLQCLGPGGDAVEWSALPATLAEALSRRMEALEPGASVAFDLVCPQCQAGWSAPMDVGGVVWAELQARAERVLLDVDALARAYGWNEAEVLALSPTRRAAYLQLVAQTA
jgi:hypothetical protein